MMLRQNWDTTKGLGRFGQGKVVPVKAITDSNLGKIQHEGGKKNHINSGEIIRLIQHAGDVWNQTEHCTWDRGRNTIGFNTIFEETNYEEIERGSSLPQLPEIEMDIGGIKTRCLIDTGSQITCVSYDFFQNHLTDNKRYPIMPITAMQIRGAMGQRSQRISRLVLVPFYFADVYINTPCLIIPKLIRNVIIGINFLDEHMAEIHCGNSRLLIIKTDKGEKSVKMLDSGIKRVELNQTCVEKNFICTTEITNITKQEIKKTLDIESRMRETISHLNLTSEEKYELGKMLDEHRNVFSDRPGLTQMYTHVIKMLDETPFVKRSYPVPLAYRAKIDEKIRELEALGIISRGATPYSSPLTYTMKKDGSVRILLDARELNTKMQAEIEKPPLTSEILQQFHGVKHMTTIDLNNAYFQIPLAKESCKYTGFLYNGKSFMYNVLPQGLKTSVGSFSRAMDLILGPEVREFCVNYLDDLIVFTCGDFSEHISHIEAVLGRLESARMTCRLEKCQFVFTEVHMLGHIITPFGIRMDPDKVAAIHEFPAPKKVKQVRAFLGLCNYYRRFAEKYGGTTRVLCDLLQKNRTWRWTEVEQRAFEKVKSLFLETVMLHHHDPNGTYYLQTDSSGYAIGSELYQLDNDGNHHVIGFISKALTGPELKWTVSEQELWAIIYSLHKFETYLRGAKLIIRTDHQALTFLKTWKMYSGRVTRWIMYLNQFDFKVEYVKGKDNIGPDVLSRYSYDTANVQDEKVNCPEVAAFDIVGKHKTRVQLREIIHNQHQDMFLREIIHLLDRRSLTTENKVVNRYLRHYRLEEGKLYYTTGRNRTVLAIPDNMTQDLIDFVHQEIGHGGGYKTLAAVKDRYFWPRMQKQVKAYVRQCHICQLAKREIRPTVGPARSIITREVGELVMTDLYGPLPKSITGVQYILVIQDTFSRLIRLYKLKVATTKSVLKCVERFHSEIKIEVLLSDNGSQFTSRQWEKNLTRWGIGIRHTAIRNPSPNITERVNKELGRIFRTYCHEKHTRWALYLDDIEDTYNNTIHCSTGFSPNEIAFGKPPTYKMDKYVGKVCKPVVDLEEIRVEARKNLIRSAEKRQEFFNIKKRLMTYEIGTLVKLRKFTQSNLIKKHTKKFALLYDGPYVVSAAPYSNTYTLVDPKTKGVIGDYSAIHLAKYYTNDVEVKKGKGLELRELD